MESDNVVRALGALAQEHRLALFRLLVQAGPEGLAAGAIAEALGVPASSLSFHLAQLSNAGLIGFLTENCCGGEAVCAPACDVQPQDERKSA